MARFNRPSSRIPGHIIATALVVVFRFVAPGDQARAQEVCDWTSAPPTIDGLVTDWPCTINVFNTTGFSSARMAVSRAPAGDTLYVYFVTDNNITTGPVNHPKDHITLMFDSDKDNAGSDPDDGGVRFYRDGTVETVRGNPTMPSSVVTLENSNSTCPSPSTGRFCIKEIPNPSDPSNPDHRGILVEAKLLPSDFGLTGGLAGTVPTFVSLISVNGTPSTWGAADAGVPSGWPDLNLGTPSDLVVVLDVSGSMGEPANSNCTGSACTTKYQRMKDAVNLSVDALQALGSPADSLGLRYFDTEIDPKTSPDDQLRDIPAAVSAISSTLQSEGPGTATAMGGGLQAAINLLTPGADPDRSKVVILFTDGIQNVNPLVDDLADPAQTSGCPLVGPDLEIRNVTGYVSNPDVPPSSSPTQLNTALGIVVHTIAITDAVGKYPDLLCKIAKQTGGQYKHTIDPQTDLQELFFDQLINSLRTQSPQLIAYRRGTLTSSGATENFIADRTGQRMLFTLSWTGDSLDFSIEKDGVAIPSGLGHDITRGKHRVFAIDVPLVVDGRAVAAGGTWEMHIEGPAGSKYEAAAVVDERAIDYAVGWGGATHIVGKPLSLEATLQIGGEPIDDATITARVLRPGEGIGNVFVDFKPPPLSGQRFEAQATPLENRFLLLLRAKGVLERLHPVERSVTLAPVGNGKYRGTFTGALVPGSYAAVFTIDGDDDAVGTIHREERVSTFVRFGEVDPQATTVRARIVGRLPDRLRRAVISASPYDRQGNALGPGWAQVIKTRPSNGAAQEDQIRDLLNGTYEIPVTVPSGADPMIQVTVFGDVAFDGRLSTLLPRFELLVGSGEAIPTGSFRTTFDPGFNAVVGLGYLVDPSLLVGVHAGYNHFRSTVSGVDDFELINVSANATYTLGSGAVSPFLRGGPGIYIPARSGGRTRFGANGGVGLQLGRGGVGFEIGADYHEVFGASTDLAHAHAGLVFRF